MIQTRKDRITTIIQQRTPFLNAIKIIQQRLQKRVEVLKRLEAIQKRILQDTQQSKLAFSSNIRERVEPLQIEVLRKEIEGKIQELELPKKRFSRTTLNIGVVGRAGQGKSSLLQSLSNLGSDIIPSGKAGHCTGVRSTILHNPNQTPHGKIIFYTESEFIEEVIAPYYDKLTLGPVPQNLNSFAMSALPTSVQNGGGGYTTQGEMLRHLQDYKNHARDYQRLLNQPPIEIQPNKIREYVAQDDVNGQYAYYNYMAVREAQITCTFRHPDVGQIALVDMPGLGDTGVGDEERLVSALGEHVDIVLYIFMPRAKRGVLEPIDFQLYDRIYRTLDGIPIEEWSFMVLNHVDADDNLENCKRIQNQVISGATGIGNNRLKFVDCTIADCKDSEEAKSVVLDPILNYLTNHMHDLDQTFISTWDAQLNILEQKIAVLLQQAQRAIVMESSQSYKHAEARQLFDSELWPEFTRALLDLRNETMSKSQEDNTTLKQYFEQKFVECGKENLLPTPKYIEEYWRDYGAAQGPLNVLINEMRTTLLYKFTNIDIQLHMDEMKKSVAEIFKRAGNLGLLGKNQTGKEFFMTLAALMPSDMEVQRETFQAFSSYELSVQGIFQSLLRRNLTYLDPNRPDYYQISGTNTIQHIHTTIKTARDETIKQWQKVLASWLMLPNEAIAAIIGNLIDQTLYSKQAKEKWRTFYAEHCDQVWPKHFDGVIAKEQLLQQWHTTVNEAMRVHTTDSLRLLPLPN